LKIIEGYIVSSLPESVKIVYNDGSGFYKYQVSKVNNMVSMVVDFKLEMHLIGPKSYESFRNFYEAIVEKDAEKIVLKKN
jgi:hypothetical protein